MNELTKKIVTVTAKQNKALAKKNDNDFYWRVMEEYWTEIMNDFGWKTKERALHLWRVFHPEAFDGNGFLYDELCDEFLSDITTRTVTRKIQNNKELQLDAWGDLPVRIAKPQMELL